MAVGGLGAATAALALCAAAWAGPSRSTPAAPTYERDILPILKVRCLSCHGETQPNAGLDLRTLGGALQGGHGGPAVMARRPSESKLYTLTTAGKMPPSGPKLTPAELKRIEAWIRAGAAGSTASATHWAFKPPARPAVPRATGAKAIALNPIDLFLLRDLAAKGLAFSPPAPKSVLLRRVTFDLIGLPPTPAELDAFLADTSPDAYGKVVDRLLADPRFGERWARHWLDAAGYADSEGVLEEDRIRPNAWRYRDYVIRAFNADKPYDQFLREQIAGDELSNYRAAAKWTPEIEEAVTATGFLRTSVDATRDDFNEHQFTEYQYRMLNDTQTILVSSTLALTLHCARCHDHKYEPLSQKDYYRVQGLLAGAIRPKGKLLPTSRRQIVAGTSADQQHARETNAKVDAAVAGLRRDEAALLAEFRLRNLDDKLSTLPEADRAPLREAARQEDAKRTQPQKELAAKYKALLEAVPEALAAVYPEFKQKREAILAAVAEQEKQRIALREIRALYDQDAAPPPTHLLIRGDWPRPGEPVEPGIPAILTSARRHFAVPAPPKDATTTGRRTALAEWLTRPDNPLTARVIVNRLWAHHFGVGLVPSVENFGLSGQRPTNQPLLDWLATELVAPTAQRPNDLTTRQPWTLKAIHRLMVTSAAYRQGSGYRTVAAAVDPENRLLWRQRPRRLEAEAIRDAVLAIAGTLDAKMYGDPVPQEVRGTGEVVPAGEAAGGRRSIYLLVRRSVPLTLLNIFDAPVMETNCTRRVSSATPAQALALLNSGFMASQSAHFAKRVAKEAGPDAASRTRAAYRLAFSRPPTIAEERAALDFLQRQSELYVRAGKPALGAADQALEDLCQALLSSNEALYVD
jgi:mono/diheme cytochrome c family protein